MHITPTGNYSGSVDLIGGSLYNCSDFTQTFSLSFTSNAGQSYFENHGDLDLITYSALNDVEYVNYGDINLQYGFSTFGTTDITNHGQISCQNNMSIGIFDVELTNHGMLTTLADFSLSFDGIFNNSDGGVLNCSSFIANSPSFWYNENAVINTTLDFTSNDNGLNNSACIDVGRDFTNNDFISSGSCGTITVEQVSTNTGTLTGQLAIVDNTPPPSTPYIDSNTGSIGPDVTFVSCGCGTVAEDCNNGIDDDGDGLTDCFDCADCGSDLSCNDQDFDGLGDYCDLDADNDGILNTDEGYQVIGIPVASTINSATGSWIDMGINITDGNTYVFNAWSSSRGTITASGGPHDRQELMVTEYGWYVTDLDGNRYEPSGLFTAGPDAPLDIPALNLSAADYSHELTYLGLVDVNANGTFDAGIDRLIDPLFRVDGQIDYKADVSGDFYAIYADEFPDDNVGDLSMSVTGYLGIDTDADGTQDHLDADSDNDGCGDALEAGFTDANRDGLVDGTGFNADGTVAGSDGYMGTTPFVTNADQQSGCPDNDNDLVSDENDLDDDNDGIFDTEEITCTSSYIEQAHWYHDAGTEGTLVDPLHTATASPEVWGAGLTASVASNLLTVSSIDAATLAESVALEEYVEYSLTSQDPVPDDMIFNVLADNIYTPGFEFAIFFSSDGFSSQRLLYQTDTPVTWTGWHETHIMDQYIAYKSNATYSFRVHFYAADTGPTMDIVYDDFTIYMCSGQFDSDDDGSLNHVDLDSDGDTCNDVNEMDFTDADGDGVVDGSGINTDGTVAGTDGYFGYNPRVVDFNIVGPTCDTDGDGVNPTTDLDDDNDGILDAAEVTVLATSYQPPCNPIVLDFTGPPLLVSGTAVQEGAVYKYNSVATGIDAKVTIIEHFGQTAPTIDDDGSDPTYFKPRSSFDLSGDGNQSYTEYLFEFVSGAGETPVVIPELFVNFNDIDGGTEFGEQNWVQFPTSYVEDSPTDLTTVLGNWVLANSGITEYSGASNINPQANFSARYINRSELRLRVGVENRITGTSINTRAHSIEFACVSNFLNPTTYLLDFDEDGHPNSLDLDSDNDGIYDCTESESGEAHTGGVLNGGVDAYGIPLSVSDGSGGVNYSYGNADASEGLNAFDTDSDGDGCTDVIEAGLPDADGDGQLGGLVPPTVDADGKVTSGGL